MVMNTTSGAQKDMHQRVAELEVQLAAATNWIRLFVHAHPDLRERHPLAPTPFTHPTLVTPQDPEEAQADEDREQTTDQVQPAAGQVTGRTGDERTAPVEQPRSRELNEG